MVEDNGPGIPADKREIVWAAACAWTRRANFRAPGLGLSLVAAVTKLHGARLVLDDADPGLRVSLKF
jgi:signal transduction histidine kinase